MAHMIWVQTAGDEQPQKKTRRTDGEAISRTRIFLDPTSAALSQQCWRSKEANTSPAAAAITIY